MQTNWIAFYDNQARVVTDNIPVQPWFHNAQGVGYSQWAVSFMTRDNDPPADSVVQVINAAAGYPEYYYWKWQYFLPSINEQNQAIFEPIKMYVSVTDPLVNYEELFNLTNADGNDPDPSSLFNI